ncbi:hypothetical protein FIBSPDRAFT_850611, partial [Athelia psychrophila]
ISNAKSHDHPHRKTCIISHIQSVRTAIPLPVSVATSSKSVPASPLLSSACSDLGICSSAPPPAQYSTPTQHSTRTRGSRSGSTPRTQAQRAHRSASRDMAREPSHGAGLCWAR